MTDYLERFMTSQGRCDSDLDSYSDDYSESDQISYISDDGITNDPVLDLNLRPEEVPMSTEPTIESCESDDEVMFPIIKSLSSESDDDVVVFPTVRDPSSDDESKNILQCNVCEKICRSVSGLAVHKLVHERGYIDRLFKCKTCNKGFSSSATLGSHMRVHKTRKSQKDKMCRTTSGLGVHSQKYKSKGSKCKKQRQIGRYEREHDG